MSWAARNQLDPWIESLIQNYGSDEVRIGGVLTADVIGVSDVPESQAQGSEGCPTGLLYLSDRVVHIPAILTAASWEYLREIEERETLTGFLNTTVLIHDYRLQFHMAPEESKCGFLLSVGKVATLSAGRPRDCTPSYISLLSVRQKICKTWRALLTQEASLNSQNTQDGFDLTQLLGEWQHDCLQEVLDDVRKILRTTRSRPLSPKPSTSSCSPPPLHTDPCTSTGWDVDRNRYKGEKRFTVPVMILLMPEEEDAQQQQTPLDEGSETPSGLLAVSEDEKTDSSHACQHTGTLLTSVDDVEQRIASPAVLTDPHTNEDHQSPPPEERTDKDMVAGMTGSDTNPWDNFSPPGESRSSSSSPSCASPESTSVQPLLGPSAESQPQCAAILTSTEHPVHKTRDSQTFEQSKGQHSFLPPYQKPPASSGDPVVSVSSSSASVSPPELASRPSNLSPETDNCKVQEQLPASDQENQIVQMQQEATEIKSRKAKRKRNEPIPEALTTLEEEETGLNQSPPSWLFETQSASGSEGGDSQKEVQTAGFVSRKTPSVHSDGRTFSYSYQVSGQNLQNFSRYNVPDALLHWAVKYLLQPKQTDNTHASGSSAHVSDWTQITSV